MRVLWLAVALSAVACSGQTKSEPADEISDAETVTKVAPDTIPDDVDSNMDSEFGAPRDFVVVVFEDGTSLKDRRRAVGAVNGRVVGGWPSAYPRSEGFYLIRISRNASNMNLVLKACKELDMLDFVKICTPDTRLGTHAEHRAIADDASIR